MKKIVIIIVVLIIIGWITKEAFFDNGTDEIKGGFIEFARYRNENNTGPIQRVYAVTVQDTTNADLIDYGNTMPHSKYGNTKVYYFLSNADIPANLYPGSTNFDEKYKAGCFAIYEKSAMGNFGLVKNPFKK